MISVLHTYEQHELKLGLNCKCLWTGYLTVVKYKFLLWSNTNCQIIFKSSKALLLNISHQMLFACFYGCYYPECVIHFTAVTGGEHVRISALGNKSFEQIK